jgi:DNA-binding CsgD family transcriptional regulator
MTNREIARELWETEKAVEGHISRIYRVLRVRSRPELMTEMTTGDTGES